MKTLVDIHNKDTKDTVKEIFESMTYTNEHKQFGWLYNIIVLLEFLLFKIKNIMLIKKNKGYLIMIRYEEAI